MSWLKDPVSAAACAMGLALIVGCSSDNAAEHPISSPVKTTPSEHLPAEDLSRIETGRDPDFSLLLPSPDREQLLLGLRETPWLELWDFAKGKRVWARKLASPAVYASFSPNSRWIAIGEARGSDPSDVLLLDRNKGTALQRYVGANDYAVVRFESNSFVKANSNRHDNGEEERIELTWNINGGKPTIRNSTSDRWRDFPGEFPITDGAITLTRSEDKSSVHIDTGRETRLLCKATQAYRLGATMHGNLAVVTDTGSLFIHRVADRKQVGRFDCMYDDDGTVAWTYISDDGKSAPLADGLTAVSKQMNTK